MFLRHGQTATKLPSGDILIAGGTGLYSQPTRGLSFNCDTRQFSSLFFDVFNETHHFADVLPNGRIVFGGGEFSQSDGTSDISYAVYTYDELTNQVTLAFTTDAPRYMATGNLF